MLSIAGVALDITIDARWPRMIRRTFPYRGLRRLRTAGSRRRDSELGPGDLTERRTLDPEAFATPEAKSIAARVNAVEWYHTIELPYGVTTPGLTDHRRQVPSYGLPQDMRGMRALDIATFDGFWAFEMERRGANVVALDIPTVHDADIPLRVRERLLPEDNYPTGAGFRLAHELLGSRVARHEASVYDVTPDDLGTFDVVFMSDLLLHLRDPQRALERVYSLVRDDGYALCAEPHNPEFDLLPDTPLQQLVGYDRYVWSIPSVTLLRCMMNVAGFGRVEELSRFRLTYRGTFPLEKVVLRAYPWQGTRLNKVEASVEVRSS
jgi:tRNA (mo5U34)-methyltransferase